MPTHTLIAWVLIFGLGLAGVIFAAKTVEPSALLLATGTRQPVDCYRRHSRAQRLAGRGRLRIAQPHLKARRPFTWRW